MRAALQCPFGWDAAVHSNHADSARRKQSEQQGGVMKVCVLGAGIAGTMTAYYLSGAGHQVTLIDRQPGPALETSKANACLLTPSQSLPWNSPGIVRQSLKWLLEENGSLVIRPRLDPAMWAWLIRFALYSRPSLHRRHALASLSLARLTLAEVDLISERHGIAFDRTKRGILTLIRTAEGRQGALKTLAMIHAIGERCRLIEKAEALIVEPALQPVSDRFDCGLLTGDDGSGDIHKFCLGVSALLPGRGVALRFGETVMSLKTRGNRIAAVALTEGEVEADTFVLALGSPSRAIARTIGIDLKLYPVQGCSITVDARGWAGMPRMPVRDASTKVAIAPLGDRIRVAGMAVLNSGSLDMPRRHFASVRRALTEVFPTLPEGSTEKEWTALRPMTADGPPLLGPTPYENLWLNTGQGPLGWSMGCGSAKIVAGLIDGIPAPVPLDPLRYDRYRF